MYRKYTLRTKIWFSKFVCALRLKSDVSINVCFWLSFLKQVSSLAAGVLNTACNYVTPHFLNTINVTQVVKAILELFILAKHSCNIHEHFIPYRYLCL